MDLTKSKDFFNPDKVKDVCHIIGCGSIGSNVAELLVRYGIKNIILWDYDRVESHNIANQLFYQDQIGTEKTKALAEILLRINPELNIIFRERYKGEMLQGHVFLCVDSMEVRQNIVDSNLDNRTVKTMTDFRTGLLEGQSYLANWSSKFNRINFRKTMNFTTEEAELNTPTTACGTSLGVSPVVKATAIAGICNFTNFINEEETKSVIIVNPFNFSTESL